MFPDKLKNEIKAELEKNRDAQAACLEVLKIAQKHYGWISDESVNEISQLIALDPAEIDSLATAYNMIFRQPAGKNVIYLCDSVSCWVMGYQQIREYISMKLGIVFGQTTADKRFTLLPVSCLGACDKAPAMIINTEFFGNLTAEKVDQILGKFQ